MALMPDQRKSHISDRLESGLNNILLIYRTLTRRFETLGPGLADSGRSFVLLGLVGLIGCLDRPRTPGTPPEVHLAIAPAEKTLTAGHRTGFSISPQGGPGARITWSVLEAGGGGIDGSGTYQAPATEGVYTIQAALEGSRGAVAQARVTVVPEPEKEISAPALVLPDAEEQTATIRPTPQGSYYWAIKGGRITHGKRQNKVTFQAGPGNPLVLTCTVTNLAGDSIRVSRAIRIAPPVSISIRPKELVITAGRTMRFGFTIDGGISLEAVWSLAFPGAGGLDQAGNFIAPMVPGLYGVRITSKDDPTVFADALLTFAKE